MSRTNSVILIALNLFLSLTAIAGGSALLLGYTPPETYLRGSLFTSYQLPGLALLFLVGGAATVALVLLSLHRAPALRACNVAAIAIIVFEIVEIASIGSPPGAPRALQLLYLLVGISIAAFSRRAATSSA